MKKNFKFLIIALLAISMLFSCVSGPKAIEVQGIEKANIFMKANVPLTYEYTLDNGIKVIVKKQATNKVFTMKVVYEGGIAMLPKDKSGIENLTIKAMLRGSKNYSYDDISNISYENSSAMAASVGRDYSEITINTIDKYWDNMLKVFIDAIENPIFDQQQVNLVKYDVLQEIHETKSKPMSVTTDKLHEKTFKDHPYSGDVQGTIESIKAITIDDIKKWHSEKLTADRMMIVAVGDFNVKKLISQLNETFGKLPVKGVKVPTFPKLKIPQACYTEVFPASKGIAYIRGDYEIPELKSKDFATLQFAYNILGGMLFEIVRTQNAACYSVGAFPNGFKASYGSTIVFKSDKPTLAKLSTDEAIAILASGETIDPKSQGITTSEGNVTGATKIKYAPLAETIDTYKAKFINAFYSDQVTNATTAVQIARSQIYFDNSYEYLKFIDDVNAITAKDVIRVVNKYLVNGEVSWMILGDKGILSKVKKNKFMKFTGKVKK